jgi:hypothetical protein
MAKIQISLYLLLFAGTLTGGYLLYSKVNSVTAPIGSTIQTGKDFIASVAPVTEQKSEFVLSNFVNTLELEKQLKVVSLKSVGTINVNRTGARDTWLIGPLLEGKASFVYNSKFTGYIQYNLAQVKYRIEGNTIIASLPTPTIYATDMIVREQDALGNLANIHSEKNTVLSGLNSEAARAYFYSQFFTETQMKDSFSKSYNQASATLTDLIGRPLSLASPNKKFTIKVEPSNQAPTFINLDNGTITFDTVLNSSPMALRDFYKQFDPNIEVTVNVKNSSSTTDN